MGHITKLLVWMHSLPLLRSVCTGFHWLFHEFGLLIERKRCHWKHFLRPALSLGDDYSAVKLGALFGLVRPLCSLHPFQFKDPRPLFYPHHASIGCNRATTGKGSCRSSRKVASATWVLLALAIHCVEGQLFQLPVYRSGFKQWFFSLEGPPHWWLFFGRTRRQSSCSAVFMLNHWDIHTWPAKIPKHRFNGDMNKAKTMSWFDSSSQIEYNKDTIKIKSKVSLVCNC